MQSEIGKSPVCFLPYFITAGTADPPGVKRMERDADCSPASITWIKNEWRFIFTRLHGVNKGQFTFRFTAGLTVEF
jgi:hypothetical protein